MSLPTVNHGAGGAPLRDPEARVSCFLVIVPEIVGGARLNVARLKVESGTGTDVALIPAEDLVWLAEQWTARRSDAVFNLDVLHVTGILTRQVLESRLKLFAAG